MKDNPLTICSIPYTDLRAIRINYVLKPWNDSWEKQIYNKLLKKHSLAGTIICSYGQRVLTRGRTGQKDRTTRTPLQPEGEQRCSGKVSSSCSTSDTRHVTVK
jgi:hypothetical protein